MEEKDQLPELDPVRDNATADDFKTKIKCMSYYFTRDQSWNNFHGRKEGLLMKYGQQCFLSCGLW